jgi:hypothetical protein
MVRRESERTLRVRVRAGTVRKGGVRAYYSHQLHSGKLVKGFSDIGTSEERRTLLSEVLNTGASGSVVTNSSSPPGWRGRHWNALEYPGRVFATGLIGGLWPINTAYLPTVDSVVENIVSHLQQEASASLVM